MNLNEVIFTDGKILRYQEVPDGLVVDFRDYAGRTMELHFSGNLAYEDRQSVGIDFSNSRLSGTGNRFLLELFDDEASPMFKVEFDRGEYRTNRDD